MISKSHCEICNICGRYGVRYCSYPEVICVKCCPKIPADKILKIMDVTYHEAISSIRYLRIDEDKNIKYPTYLYSPIDKYCIDGKTIIKLDINNPIFWCTTNYEGLLQRCGVDQNINITLTENYIEKIIIIVIAYWNKEKGLKDMKMLKQNFRRIRSGKPYVRY